MEACVRLTSRDGRVEHPVPFDLFAINDYSLMTCSLFLVARTRVVRLNGELVPIVCYIVGPRAMHQVIFTQ